MERPANGNGRIQATVVSHTHWDREWYLPFQRFRVRLVETVDKLLAIMENEPSFTYFTLDGQTVILEDYLEVRPENRERLTRLIAEQRIQVGPWYVLPDEFLPSPESLVRNLLIGREVAAQFGTAMPVGYLPDTFGHPAQLPQLLRGFGLDNAVIYRGVEISSSEFHWEAPDGSRVLALYLPTSYCNAMTMTTSPDRFVTVRLPELLTKLTAMATTPNILFMNGCDHLAPRHDLARVVARANRVQDRAELVQGTLPLHIARVRASLPRVPVVRGEFRRPRPGRVTPGVISSRIYLKQENARTSRLLERYAEPVAALASLQGADYPRHFLRMAWKYLIQNHPHDSICGCSVDEVHRDMMVRFRWAQEIGHDVLQRASSALVRQIESGKRLDRGYFAVFNPSPAPRSDTVTVTIHFLARGKQFHLEDEEGRVVPHQEIRRYPAFVQYDSMEQALHVEGRLHPLLCGESRAEWHRILSELYWERWDGEAVDIIVDARDMPAFGYRRFAVAPGAPAAQELGGLRSGATWLENEHVRVDVASNGTLDVLYKPTGTRFSGLNAFEQRADTGDEYTFCPLPYDEIISTQHEPAEISRLESGPVRATLEVRQRLLVPKRLHESRTARVKEHAAIPITTRISLTPSSPRVEVGVELTNTAEDHRLRAVFPTALRAQTAHARGQFMVMERPVTLEKVERNRPPGPDEEQAVATHPHHDFVDLHDGQDGLALLSRGLTEYEAEETPAGTTLYLTLLRCVGWLSRPDLHTRYGNAGPMLPTPEAQCPGPHYFEYALLPHQGSWLTGRVHDEAERYTVPMLALGSVSSREGLLPATASFLSLEPHALVISAIKRAETDDAVVLRFYNVSSEPCEAHLKAGFPVRRCERVNMAEEPDAEAAQPLATDEGIRLPVRGHEIVTIKVYAERRSADPGAAGGEER